MISFGSNINSIRQQNHLSRTSREIGTVMERLSTGLRINNAGDDAAGLAIANQLQSKVRGLSVAEDNIQMGQSLLGVLEGGLNQIIELVQDFRDLGVEASNGTVTDFTPYTTAGDGIRAEITRISDSLEYNGINLLSGATSTINIQIGPDNDANHRLALGNSIFADVDAATLSLDSITNTATAQNAVTDADAAIVTINTKLANVGAYQNRLSSALSLAQTTKENYSAAEGRIRNADIAEESARLTQLEVLQQAGTAMLAQANQMPAIGLGLLG